MTKLGNRSEAAIQEYMQLVTPDAVRSKFVAAGLFLLAFELLRDSLVDQLQGFYGRGFRDGKRVVDSSYDSDVKSRHRSILRASALWFQEAGVLTEADLASLEEIRQSRNRVAHELAELLVEEQTPSPDLLSRIRELIRRVDTWWILNIEVPANEEFDGQAPGPEDVQSGRMLLLDLMISVSVYGYSETEVQVRQKFDEVKRQLHKSGP